MVFDYQCVTEEAVASSRLMKARQYVTAETLMMGIRPGQTIAKFRGWPRDMVMQMRLWHIGVAEPLHKRHPLPRQMSLGQCHTGVAEHGNL